MFIMAWRYFILGLGTMVSVSRICLSDSCDRTPTEVLSSDGMKCLELVSGDHLDFSDVFSQSFWINFCIQSDSLSKCLQSQLSQCSPEFLDDVIGESLLQLQNPKDSRYSAPGALTDMMKEGCDGSEAKQELTEYFEATNNLECASVAEKAEMQRCMKTWQTEADSAYSWNMLSAEHQQSIIRYGYAVFQCVLNQVHTNCDSRSHELLVHVVYLTVPQVVRTHLPRERAIQRFNLSDIKSSLRATVGVYGDPHLLVFNISTPMTCSAAGEQVYISNPLFTVIGSNRKVAENGATVLDSIFIEFYDSGRVSGEYEANDGMLPETFSWGEKTVNPYRNPIHIVSLIPGEKILINASSPAHMYSFLIRRKPSGYFFSLRIGQGVLKSSSGLLSTGCSHSKEEIINVTKVSRVTRDTMEETCEHSCHDLGMEGLGERSGLDLAPTCLFDCRTTGDTTYGDIGRSFLEDIIELYHLDSVLPLVEPPAPPMSQAPQVSSAAQDMTSHHLLYLAMLTLCSSFVLMDIQVV